MMDFTTAVKKMSKGRTTPGYECYFYGPIVAKYTPSLQTNKIYIHCYVPFSSPLFFFYSLMGGSVLFSIFNLKRLVSSTDA